MKRIARVFRLLAFCLVVIAIPGKAQDYLNAVGNPAFSVQIPVENGFINVANGNLHLEFPLATHKQRGSLTLNERLVYDSRIWKIVHYSGYYWWPLGVPNTSDTQGGWRFVSGNETGSITSNLLNSRIDDCPGFNPTGDIKVTVTQSTFTWTDPSGTVHPFDAVWNENIPGDYCELTPTAESTQGWSIDASGYQIYMDGTDAGDPTSFRIVDKSGTQVFPQVIDRYGNYWSSDANGNLIDDVGRTPVIVTVNGNVTYYDVLAPNGPINNNGTRVRYTVTTAPVQVSTHFNQQAVSEWPNGGASGVIYPVQSIQLPDGSAYSFTYDSYGEMTSVTLPTGGVVQYGWTNYFDSYQNVNRWLSSRTVGSNPPMTLTPQVLTQCASNGTGCQEQVTVHKPSGDETVYQLTLNNGAWNTNVNVYNGSAASGSLVESVANTYDFSNPCTNQLCNGAQYITKSSATTTLDTGVKTQTQYVYSNSWTGNLSSQKQWNYYTGNQPGTPTQKIDYSYAYLDDPSQITTLNNGIQVAQTNYGYAYTAPQTSGVPQHGTTNAGGPYLQSVSQWLNTGGSVKTTYTMDDSGMVTQTLDPRGYTSSTSYQCGNSLPYQATNALGQVTTYSYDCNSGAITSVKDPNDSANGRAGTTYQYEAGAGRVQSISYPDGGQTTYSYPSSRETDTAVIATPNPTVYSQDIADDFGRPYQHIQAGVSTETTYDTNGRTSCTTNPHSSGSSPTDGSTCPTIYDGLDRPKSQTQPDGSTLTWSYSGNVVTSTDEAGHSWQRTSDAFGRLTKVIEPNGVETDYSYNGLTSTVSQKGVGSETARPDRVFTKDSLGRTISVNAPENGTTTYGYDGNGNLTLKVDPRGSDVHYDYDALNRLLNITYGWQPTPNRHFVYDQSTGWAGAQTNTIGRLSGAYTDPGTYPVQDYSRSDELFSYDAMGRTISIAAAFPSEAGHAAHESRMTYDLAGNMTSLTYPDGRTVTQSFDGASNLQSVVFDNWNGQHYGYNYVSSASYWPDGSPRTMTLGNGVVETFNKNNRLQPSEVSAHANGPALSGSLFDKQYAYTSATQSANNGNIMQIVDSLSSPRTQSFGYDSLNRLASFSTQDSALTQNYTLDSFGNLTQAGTQQFEAGYTTGNRVSDGFGYDGNGNVNIITAGGITSYYSFDADDRFTVFNGATYYTYSALGDRVRKDTDGSYTEYQYFNGKVISEKPANGDWIDYIYANGQKIAMANTEDIRIHTHGTFDNTGEAAVWTLPLSGYQVKNGDRICWRQWSSVPGGGSGINFTNGVSTGWNAYDQDGNLTNGDTTTQVWHNRCVDLSPYSNLTIGGIGIGANDLAPAGTWDFYFADMSITSVDGSVTPVFFRNSSVGLSGVWTNKAGPTDLQASAEILGDTEDPETTTTYYVGDQIGSTRMLISAPGWPVSNSTFYPFGQESSPSSDPNPYRFAGLERDGESGLDHATFRDYSSTQGRWMSPDPYLGSYDFSNPQSFNRYSYVGNMPLSAVDPLGLDSSDTVASCGAAGGLGFAAGGPVGGAFGAGGCVVLDALKEFVKMLGLFGGPSFAGSLNPRPSMPQGTGQPDWDSSVWNEHIGLPAGGQLPGGGLGGLLEIPSAGCEFGACGFQNGPYAGQAGRGTLQYGAASALELFGIAWPYLDLNDPNHRLFGTHYCGPGGGGRVNGALDSACQAHDACYASAGLQWYDNFNPALITSRRSTALRTCNQQLCNATAKIGGSAASTVRTYFTETGLYGCHI